MADFKEGKKYVVAVSVKFEGVFSHYYTERGVKYAIFITSGVGRANEPQTRKVDVDNVVSFGKISE